MNMFDKTDPSILWVAPEPHNGDGTADSPFNSIDRALAIVKPGTTIVLRGGVYPNNVTIQVSGTIRLPIRIMAEQGAEVEIRGGCWFFYDTSDLIISGLTFKNALLGAISVVGSCNRNRFENLRFSNCGTKDDTSCTLFFGGAGGSCNIVEDCVFEHAETDSRTPQSAGGKITIGIMVSEGDTQNSAPIKDHLFRRNRFVNYNFGILIGAGDAALDQHGHIVEYNTIEKCGTEGILVKCGDTMVRGNLVRGCRKNSITIGAGNGSTVEANRIVDCANGLNVNGSGHTVSNNCIVRCGNQAIRVCGASTDPVRIEASNLFIENNTCIDCGSAPENAPSDRRDERQRIAGILIDPGTSCIVSRNLFYGQGKPYECAGKATSATDEPSGKSRCRHHPDGGYIIRDNIASGRCESMEGVAAAQVAFKEMEKDDFSNESGYGAFGWMLTPEAVDPELDAVGEGEEYRSIDFEDEIATDPDDFEAAGFESFMDGFFLSDAKKDE